MSKHTHDPTNPSQKGGLASEAVDEAWKLYMDKPQREPRSSSGPALVIAGLGFCAIVGALWFPSSVSERVIAVLSQPAEAPSPRSDVAGGEKQSQPRAPVKQASLSGGSDEALAPESDGDEAVDAEPAIELSLKLRTRVVKIAERPLAEAERTALAKAIAAAKKKDVIAARAAAGGLQDSAARKLVEWALIWYAPREMSAEAIFSFAQANPDWPTQHALRARAEAQLLLEPQKPDTVLALFKAQAPRTDAGKAALARALLANGKGDEATTLIREAWHTGALSASEEAQIIKDFSKVLTPKDHYTRVSYLLMRDSRWRKTRAARAVGIRRMFPRLSKADRAIAQARLGVYLKQRNARRAMRKLSKSAFDDAGVQFQQIQLLRRSKRFDEAVALMKKAPQAKAVLLSPDNWWEERRALAYRALNTGDARTAYQLVSKHGPVGVNGLNEARFMSGWIALRFLNDAKQARVHFADMTQSADGPRTRGQSHYWLGRALLTLGKRDEANEMFAKAAREKHTFYGQLAIQTLNPKVRTLALKPAPEPSEAQITGFAKNDAVRAAVLAKQIGDRVTKRRFLQHLRSRLIKPEQFTLQAELALALGDTQMSVRAGKSAMARGFSHAQYAYPINQLPTYTPLRQPLERAFLYSIARQESEFNTTIQSGAGARGILQVMPITARHICRQYKIKCNIRRLMSDPAYNTKIASAYIADRNSDYDGSYVMTMPGYNAGPGRVRGWVRQLGDPRDRDVDPIDWIERLHLRETREYTKKVLANIQMYRARFGKTAEPLRLWSDIMRARRVAKIPTAMRFAETTGQSD